MLYRVAVLIGALAVAVPASAAERVVNGGFETGNFSGWTESDPYGGDPTYVGVDAIDAHSGAFGAYLGTQVNNTFGNPVDYVTLSQSIATTSGQSYTLSFWLTNAAGGVSYTPAATDSARVMFGTQTLLSLTGSALFPYTRYSYTVTGNGSPTTLAFRFSNIPYYWSLDDVSLTDAAVTPGVPEPATWAMLVVGFGLIGGAARRRTRVGVRFA